jgi:hypothetical protein
MAVAPGRVGAAPGERLLVLAPELSRLKAGLAVISGEAPALGAAEGGPAEGSIFYLSATDLGAMQWEKVSEVAKNTAALVIDIGERAGETFADVTLTATSPEEADKIGQVAQGALAMASLVAGDDPKLSGVAKLATTVKVSIESGNVVARWRHGSAELLGVLKALRDEKPAGAGKE